MGLLKKFLEEKYPHLVKYEFGIKLAIDACFMAIFIMVFLELRNLQAVEVVCNTTPLINIPITKPI